MSGIAPPSWHHYLVSVARLKKTRKLIRAYLAIVVLPGIGVCVAGLLVPLNAWNDTSRDASWTADISLVKNFDYAAFANDTVTLTNSGNGLNCMESISLIFAKCPDRKIKGELRLDSKKLAFKGVEMAPTLPGGGNPGEKASTEVLLASNHKMYAQ